MAKPPGHTHYQTEMQNERDEMEQGDANKSFDLFRHKKIPVMLGGTHIQKYMIRFLKTGGPFINTSIDESGRMPMDYAVKFKLTRVIAYLQKAGEPVQSKARVELLWDNHPHSRTDSRIADDIVNDI
jgi:hypothetical protein